ncbi:hypothetical protein CTA1_12225 [Colletotrichum tanaceti]|uniref:Secreted protein n=1 Tax=Colletotrichum tanaceti TaxID=1306861 RepID=A0A4U6X6M3_9PEZI|nr:hypothetical protein CTA1_12225 [Colletotrichum tanaceti]
MYLGKNVAIAVAVAVAVASLPLQREDKNSPEPARTGETMFSTPRQTFGGGGDEALVDVQTAAPFRKCRMVQALRKRFNSLLFSLSFSDLS